ncbi:MAG: hypothetical protein AAF098_04095 [Pseudomonadota bacterium]
MRQPFPYTIWRLQRMQSVYFQLASEDRAAVADWSETLGGAGIFNMELGPELRRDGLAAALA